MCPLFHSPTGLDPERLSPGAKGEGINLLLVAWLDAASSVLSDTLQRRAYREIFSWIELHRGDRMHAHRYDDGHIGFTRNPRGVLVMERWSEAGIFRDASVYGWGSTAGSALLHGRSMPALRQTPNFRDSFRYRFFDLWQMRAIGANSYRPELYRLDRRDGLLERCFD